MSTLQTRLQQGLNRLDPWLDACFPVATALICTKQRLMAYSLLTLWILIRLLLGSDKQNWRWILITLTLLNAGLIIGDRDLKPGGASDYLIIVLSFAAGFQRPRSDWMRSLAWIGSCAVPLLIGCLSAGDNLIQLNTSSFTGFNINRIGFLAALLTTVNYSLFQGARSLRLKSIYTALLAASITAAFLTESRAAIAAPAIAIAIDLASRIRLAKTGKIIAFLAAISLMITSFHQWYSSPEGRGILAADTNRITTIECWLQSTTRNTQTTLLGLGYDQSAIRSCGPGQIQGLKGRTTPLTHAHNVYVQLFAETGLVGLLAGVTLTLLAFVKSQELRESPTLQFTRPLLIFIFLMALGATWQSMMLNQVLIGYGLSALSAKVPETGEAVVATP
jgi:O-antigen ligase